MRRELGRQLAAWRRAADYTQVQLARQTGYARSTVSTVESGSQHVLRIFWERCDAALGTGHILATAHDRLQERQAELRRVEADRVRESSAARLGASRWHRRRCDLGPASIAEYGQLGWMAEEHAGRLELVTGTVVDALELQRPAGMLAVQWWLGSGGAPDESRGLPALPHPDEALAVIAAGPRFFFLVAAGACPWDDLSPVTAGPDEPGPAEASPAEQNTAEQNTAEQNPAVHTPAGNTANDDATAIRWHAGGSRIPAPPSPTADGSSATWVHVPVVTPEAPRLANPITLLDMLAKAATAVRSQPTALTLPGGILAVPAWASPDAPEVPDPGGRSPEGRLNG
jgi:transcriptional regulator with XRE-family HTH domain